MALKTKNHTPLPDDETSRRIANLERSPEFDGTRDQFGALSENDDDENYDDDEYTYDDESDEDEEYSGIDWENYDSDGNPIDEFYAQKLKKAEARAARRKKKESDDDVEDLYSKTPDRSSRKGLLRSIGLRNAIVRNGPTVAIVGAIVGAFGFSSIVLGPAALLVNLSDLMTNHSDFSNRLFLKTGTSYIRAVLTGETRDCTGKIKCKFATISENRLRQWEERGIRVTYDERTIPGITGKRYKVRSLEYKNREVRSIFDYKTLRYTDPEFASLLKRFPIKVGYLNTKSTISKSLNKFSKNLANKFRSSKAADKEERRSENNTKMNQHTGVTVDDNGRVRPDSVRSKAKSKIDAAMRPSIKNIRSFRTGLDAAGAATIPAVLTCMAYDIVRAAQAAITLYWHSELIAFALPFLQAGAEAKESGVNGGGFDWETAEYIGDRVMQPVTEKDVRENPDVYTEDMIGKTMMDSKGINAAIHGDHAKLAGTYAEKYTGWGPSVLGIGLVRDLEDTLGKKNIHAACTAAEVTQYISSAACLAKLVQCGLSLVAYMAITQIWGNDIVEYIVRELQEPAMDLIAEANLSSSLHGPPAGEALASAAGVLASYQDRAAGFAVAGDPDQAYHAYNNLMNDDEYRELKIAEEKQRAAENQLDPTNPYSFAGRITSQIARVPWGGSPFSILANAMSTVSSIPVVATAHAAKEGMYQPISIYQSPEAFFGALANCDSPGLKEIEVPCVGESGRSIPYIMPEVEKCMDEEAQGNSDVVCIEKAIDYLASRKYKNKDDEEKPFIDGDTGRPSEFSSYSKSGTDFSNPFLMFMRYCGDDRTYPLGYTDSSIKESYEGWSVGAACVAGREDARKGISDTDLGWMSYYYNMCIALFASEENLEYCWDDQKATKNTRVGGGAWVLPVEGPCTSPYGPRWGSMHQGIDIAPPEGTPIVAPTDMKILKVVKGGYGGGYGTHVIAQATDGSGKGFLFGHMIEGSNSHLNEGDEVPGGTEIGKVGNTGHSFGAHLHFNIYPEGVNPLLYSGEEDPVPVLAEKGLSVSCG